MNHSEEYVCRCCLVSGANMKYLFDENIRNAFVDATKIEVSEKDGFPSWLCSYCYLLLLKIIKFKLLASKTDEFLKCEMSKNNDFKILTSNSFDMLNYTPMSHSNACSDCSNLSTDDTSVVNLNKNIETYEMINTFKMKNIVVRESNKKNIQPEGFGKKKFYKLNYSSENDNIIDEVTSSTLQHDPVTKGNQSLESEDSPLILIAEALRLTRKRRKKAKRINKLSKDKEKIDENLTYEKLIFKNEKMSTTLVNNLNVKSELENGKKISNSVLYDTAKKSLEKLSKFNNIFKNEELHNDAKDAKIPLKKRSKMDRIRKLKSFPNRKLSIDIRSKFQNEKQLSNNIENTSTVLLNCDMSKVAIIEMDLDEQIKEMKCKQESEQFKSARYKCEKCVKVFPYEDSLKNHLIRHQKSYGCCECRLCGQRFLTPRVLKSHQIAHAKRYRCLECNRILKFKATVTHHMMRHGGTYSCRICGHLSTNKEANKVHQRIHTHQDTYNCSLCPKVLGTKQDYGIHMRRHTGDMPFKCVECTKLFLTNAALQSHRAVHSTARHFYCAECDVSFKTKDIMLTHFRKSSRHVDPALLRFQCHLCPKRFPTEEALTSHSDSYHTRCAKLACDACPAQFVSSNGLRNHKRTVHEGYRPRLTHVCEACGRAFSTKALVTNHLRTHTGEQPFECPTCQRRFSQRSAMQTHIKLVHLKIKRNMSIPKDKPHLPVESEQQQPKDISLSILPKREFIEALVNENNSNS